MAKCFVENELAVPADGDDAAEIPVADIRRAVMLTGGSVAATGEAQVFDPAARVGIKRGTHTGYQFGPSGAMLAARQSTGAYREGNAAELRTLPGQTGLWFRMTSGTWKGYWLRASNVVTLVSG